jgi:hypothetical protein
MEMESITANIKTMEVMTMFTEQALLKARIDLYNISANFAMKDYRAANYNSNGKRKSKKHIPYTLSQETEEAKDYYSLVFCNDPNELTQEQEEQIKYYLLTFRLHRTEYLQDAGGKAYFANSIAKLGLTV